MHVVVVGGGITGLAAAHRLLESAQEGSLGLDLRLLEAGDRLGGVISTERRDGFVLERGPDSMITDKPWGLALARRLGLEDQVIGTNMEHRRAFVVRNGRLMPVPEGFQILAPAKFAPLAASPIFSWPGKLRMAMDLVLPRRRQKGDESLGSFVLRRLGREALERMAQPMVAGIYGADPMNLSLQATLPRFLEMEREHGSVIRGMWARAAEGKRKKVKGKSQGSGVRGQRSAPTPEHLNTPTPNTQHPTPNTSGTSGARYGLFVSFREGMQTLTDALVQRIPESSISLGTRVEALTRDEGRWRLTLSRGEITMADAVILALPAYHAAELVRDLNPSLARLMAEIPYASAATMSLCYRRDQVPHPLDGFGFVVPAVEGLSLMGCTFSHVKFAGRAPEGFALLRAFLGHELVEECDDAELERRVRRDLKQLVGVEAAPQFVLTWRGPHCMPHYHVGHLDRVAAIERHAAALPGLALAGNAYRGVGVPDCVHSGEQAATRALTALHPDAA